MELGVVISLIGVGVAILIQTVSVVWFISRLAARVDFMEERYRELRDAKYEPRLAKIETIMEIVQTQQDEQIQRLDKILTNMATIDKRRTTGT